MYGGPTIGPKIQITLNGNEDYSVENLKSIMLNAYVNDDNRCYFQECSRVCIASFEGVKIFKFCIDEEESGFWEYSRPALRTKSHSLKMLLLTTKLSSDRVGNNRNETKLGESLDFTIPERSNDLKDLQEDVLKTYVNVQSVNNGDQYKCFDKTNVREDKDLQISKKTVAAVNCKIARLNYTRFKLRG